MPSRQFSFTGTVLCITFTGVELLEDTLAIYGTEEAFAEDVIKELTMNCC